MRCRNCQHATFLHIISLGNRSLPRFPQRPNTPTAHFPLTLLKCLNCQLVQLDETVPRWRLFNNFWYASNISTTIQSDLINLAQEGAAEASYTGVAVDIGANDGTLLKAIPKTMRRIGFEPAKNIKTTYERVNGYFTRATYTFPKASLITAIGMFYDLQDPVRFCQDVAFCLAKNGCFIIQQNYLPDMIQKTTFDNICHEHLTYFSLTTLREVLRKAKLTIYNYSFNKINGGSFRVFVCHEGERPEAEIDEKPLDYAGFAGRVQRLVENLNKKLTGYRDKKVMLYGAGTRGATIYGSLKPFPFKAAIDNNPVKHGRYYLDTDIRIISHKEAIKDPPDAYLLLPYFLKGEVTLENAECILPIEMD